MLERKHNWKYWCPAEVTVLRLFAIIACSVLSQRAMAADPIVIGVEDLDYLPHYAVDGAEYVGFGAEILLAFAASESLTIHFEPLPVARLFRAFIAGDVDMKYPDSPLWSAEIKAGVDVTYSDPVVPYIDGVFVRPETFGRPVNHYERLGIVTGFTAWSWLDLITSERISLEENRSLDRLIRQTITGRIDATYGNVAVIKGRLRVTQDDDQLLFDDGLPHSQGHYYLSSINRPDIVARFNAWLAANADRVAAMREEFNVSAAFFR